MKKIINQSLILISKNDKEFKNYLLKNINKKDILIIDKLLIKKNIILNAIYNKYRERTLIINGNENIKNLKHYTNLTEKILMLGIDRESKLFSFGGGTIGDLSGFVASTLLRGIKHVIVPTTLLSMVDSSIGGKTGVNSNIGKNLIGSFYIPEVILINTKLLNTLPKRELSCGFGEIIKYAFIKNIKLKKLLSKYSLDDYKNMPIDEIIEESIRTKLQFTKDLQEKKTDKNSRGILNFGHTFGHAIEVINKFKGNIKHGEAVGLGMILEMHLSYLLKFKPNSINKLLELLIKYGLPINHKNIDEVIGKIKLDKKVIDKNINIILIKNNYGFVKKIDFKKLKELTIKLL